MTPDHTALPETGVVDQHCVAKYFGVGVRTIEKWVAHGRLNKLDLPSRHVRFDVNEVRKLGMK